MAALSAHPVLFGLLFIFAGVELGLTAYNVHEFNDHTGYPSEEYKHRFRFLLFCSVWTVFLSALHVLFAAWIGAFLTFITWIFWLVGAVVYHLVRWHGSCNGTGVASRCRQLVAVQAIAWIEFALALLAFIAIGIHVHGSRGRRTYRDGLY